jgi:hypothetical protein
VTSPIADAAPPADIPLTIDEKNAMRAYLQRCEVRLSTMHRVVTAFVSGAALMVLIPVFFKDVIGTLIQVLLNDFGNRFPALGAAGLALTMVLYAALLYVLGLSIFVPLRALYLLFKDITDFYITITTPGTPETEGLESPAFALTGVTLSTGEVPESVRREIWRYQYQPQSIGFMLPFSDAKRRDYFQPLLETTRYTEAATGRERYRIVPPERDLDVLKAHDVLLNADAHYLQTVLYFNAALGLGRSYQRTLAMEVAKTEMSLVRHGLYLRRLVFRYVATLLMFIWTLMVLFGTLSVLQADLVQAHPQTEAAGLLVIALGCAVWSVPVRYILHRPMNWIYRPVKSPDDPTPDAGAFDPQLNRLEHALKLYHIAAVVASLVGLGIAAMAMVQGG